MRYVIIMLFFLINLGAFEIGSSFEADFIQTIQDDKGKKIVYSGKVYAAKPQNILWSYKEPVQKDVYISNLTVTVLEPELEQAIIKQLDADLNLFELLSKAKKVSDQEYSATYRDQEYHLYVDQGILESIHYKDSFEHTIEIAFVNQKKDHSLAPELLTPKIPEEFDIIRQY